MCLTGQRGRTLTFPFLLELSGRKRKIDMDLTPFCFRKKRIYPFDFIRDAACAGVFGIMFAAAESLPGGLRRRRRACQPVRLLLYVWRTMK